MSSSYRISYAYRKPGTTSWTSTSFTAKAGSEQMAVRIVEDRHKGYEVQIRSIDKVS
jgi:hypothetical protein